MEQERGRSVPNDCYPLHVRAKENKKAPDWGRGSLDCIDPTRRSLFLLRLCVKAQKHKHKNSALLTIRQTNMDNKRMYSLL